MIELQPYFFEGHTIHVHENERIVFGFTELDFPPAALRRFFKPRPLLFLKQIHSARIIKAGDWHVGAEGDGLFLERPGPVAVMQTADCMPLFFFNDDFSAGGVIHVGWRGLWQGIEKNLLEMMSGNPQKYVFYLGPAVEKKCYPVGEEVHRLFKDKPYAENVFTSGPDGKYLLDLKAGLLRSLQNAGIGAARIQDSGLCTFCLKNRFPSFRRDGQTGKRIYNFLSLL